MAAQEKIGINNDYEMIDFRKSEMADKDSELYKLSQFKPQDESGFNIAFGFIGAEMTDNIG